MRTLKPQFLLPSYFEGLEKEIAEFFDNLIFRPLFAELLRLGVEKQNSSDPLAEAIIAGKVTFEGGVFKGAFNSKALKQLEKIGAKYSARKGGWFLQSAPPVSVSMAVAQYAANATATQSRLLAVLDGINVDEAVQKAAIRHKLGLALDRMDTDWQKTVESIGIVPKLTVYQKAQITEQWGENLELYIKGWSNKKILQLRENIAPHTLAGGRSSKFAKIIQKSYGASKSKAKFLARQETSLLLATMKKSRYQEAGIQKYKWSTSHDERVRKDHKHLDNNIFTWDSPPIVDKKTGARAHPSEYFMCRCVAIPVLE